MRARPPRLMDDAIVRSLRHGLSRLDPSAATSVSGDNQAKLEEMFAPQHHGNALNWSTTLVLGARGTGKSFWASVLNQDDTRTLAGALYPRLGLDQFLVAVGFDGVSGGAVTKSVLDYQVPAGKEKELAGRFWQTTIARAALSAADPAAKPPRVKELMARFQDPEDWLEEMDAVDRRLAVNGRRLLVLFDALDSLSDDWVRLRHLIDGLMDVAWQLRGFEAIRAKLFMRPDQLDELGLRFVELSKLRSGAAELNWDPVDLYGMLYARLAFHEEEDVKNAVATHLKNLRLDPPPSRREDLRAWSLAHDQNAQERLFVSLAGPYMGTDARKGRTYAWPTNHLADAFDVVTPRSFLILLRNATERATRNQGSERVVTPEGIREGLKAASRVRIDQLASEFPWIRRVLAPLAGLRVPNEREEFFRRWRDSETVAAALKKAREDGALPPIRDDMTTGVPRKWVQEDALAQRLFAMGVLSARADGRYDMPDLFRIGAALLRKGGVAPGR